MKEIINDLNKICNEFGLEYLEDDSYVPNGKLLVYYPKENKILLSICCQQDMARVRVSEFCKKYNYKFREEINNLLVKYILTK